MTTQSINYGGLGGSERVYLDHNATTPLHPDVRARLLDWANDWGNPSSIHQDGRGPKARLRDARDAVAKALGVSPLEVVFTSCGSESNSAVMTRLLEVVSPERRHVLVSELEHPSLKNAALSMQRRGYDVEFFRAQRNGVIDLNDFKNRLRPGSTGLVSLMLANNETGVIQPVNDIVRAAKAVGARVHTDAVQALGKIPVSLRELGVDFASFSAHKFYALKGAGVLYIAKGAVSGSAVEPLIYGGGQERHRRGGTENVMAIASLGLMCGKIQELEDRSAAMRSVRDHVENEVLRRISEATINGAGAIRLPSTSSLLIPGVDGETLLMALDMEGFAVSTGAACSSGNPEPSPVLLAMGLSREEAQCSLRIGVGWGTTEREAERFLTTLERVVARLRSIRSQRWIDMDGSRSDYV